MRIKLLILFIVAIGLVWFLHSDYIELLSLQNLKNYNEFLEQKLEKDFFAIICAFFIAYVLIAASSVPGATVMTLAAGSLFGLFKGFLLVSFASTIGATLSMLLSRYLLKDLVKNKFAKQIEIVDRQFQARGIEYLMSLRLLPVFPFFVINLVMGLTNVSWLKFYVVSQFGMMPATLIYVNAGTKLATIDSISSILKPEIFISLILLAFFPFIISAIYKVLKKKKLYAGYKRPSKFDYNIIVLGAGSAGLVTSYIGALANAKILLIEMDKMGGDCLNTGCVPSKALIKSSRIANYIKQGEKFGLSSAPLDVHFKEVMDRVHDAVKEIAPHDSVERYQKLGVECLKGEAKIISPWEVSVNDKVYTTRNIVIATGAEPFVPDLPGISKVDYLTSETLWKISDLPKNILIVGAGPIGCEMAQAFRRLGSEVVLIDRGGRLLSKEDDDVSTEVAQFFKKEGITFLGNVDLISFGEREGKYYAECELNYQSLTIEFDKILFAVGRRARLEGYGLEELGLVDYERGTLLVNEFLETKLPNIYACGDVVGPFQFTHFAAYQAWFCAMNSLFGGLKKFKVDYRVIPRCTYIDPEVAAVGLSERQAVEQNISFEVHKFDLGNLDRAIIENEKKGFIKVLVEKGGDKILGVVIVGSHAGEYLSEFVLAMKNNLGLNKILSVIHPYPTMSEANKFVAGEWRKKNKPQKLLALARKYHAWQRG